MFHVWSTFVLIADALTVSIFSRVRSLSLSLPSSMNAMSVFYLFYVCFGFSHQTDAQDTHSKCK